MAKWIVTEQRDQGAVLVEADTLEEALDWAASESRLKPTEEERMAAEDFAGTIGKWGWRFGDFEVVRTGGEEEGED